MPDGGVARAQAQGQRRRSGVIPPRREYSSSSSRRRGRSRSRRAASRVSSGAPGSARWPRYKTSRAPPVCRRACRARRQLQVQPGIAGIAGQGQLQVPGAGRRVAQPDQGASPQQRRVRILLGAQSLVQRGQDLPGLRESPGAHEHRGQLGGGLAGVRGRPGAGGQGPGQPIQAGPRALLLPQAEAGVQQAGFGVVGEELQRAVQKGGGLIPGAAFGLQTGLHQVLLGGGPFGRADLRESGGRSQQQECQSPGNPVCAHVPLSGMLPLSLPF